jgi:Flp pilus assembly protein TadG
MVGALLTILALAVLQLALALHVRNTVTDAAAEGARHASLADSSLDAGVDRTADLLATALGPGYAAEITATTGEYRGVESAIVSVRTRLPLIGLLGLDEALEVQGHAALESLDD